MNHSPWSPTYERPWKKTWSGGNYGQYEITAVANTHTVRGSSQSASTRIDSYDVTLKLPREQDVVRREVPKHELDSVVNELKQTPQF